MGTITVFGGSTLTGEVQIQGSKNSVLPIIAASLLCKDITTIYNCPKISDVDSMLDILQDLGGHIKWYGHTLIIDTRSIITATIDESYTNKLRASILYMGALLGRTGEAVIGLPGGCDIGSRPIDYHVEAFRKMGAEICFTEEVINCCAPSLHGKIINLCYPSVGTTENIMLAAVLAQGTTIIHNASKEPELVDLGNFLTRMGAKITGVGTSTITIVGVEQCHGAKFFLPYDRIVAGTYMLAALGTRSVIKLTGIDEINRIENIIKVVVDLGGTIKYEVGGLIIDGSRRASGMNIITSPHPGIPTDLQSMLLTVLATANGKSQIIESVFESRFGIVRELKKMGAQIEVDNRVATIIGINQLNGMELSATDLRGGAALIVAALMADGTSRISNSQYMERGYEDFVWNLSKLGAQIRYEA